MRYIAAHNYRLFAVKCAVFDSAYKCEASDLKDLQKAADYFLKNCYMAGNDYDNCQEGDGYGRTCNFERMFRSFQGQGIGQKLLLWGMNHIKGQGCEEIILHVTEWNENAVRLYLKNGFSIKKREKVR